MRTWMKASGNPYIYISRETQRERQRERLVLLCPLPKIRDSNPRQYCAWFFIAIPTPAYWDFFPFVGTWLGIHPEDTMLLPECMVEGEERRGGGGGGGGRGGRGGREGKRGPRK